MGGKRHRPDANRGLPSPNLPTSRQGPSSSPTVPIASSLVIPRVNNLQQQGPAPNLRADRDHWLSGIHDPTNRLGQTQRTWHLRSDEPPREPLDFSCPRLRAVELLLDSPRGLRWIDNTAKGLRLPPSLRPLLRGRIRLLRLRGARVAADLCVDNFEQRVLLALDALSRDVWLCIFKDSTSPVVCLIDMTHEVLDRGIGQVGAIHIP